MILSLRTDTATPEIRLYSAHKILAEDSWFADRTLARVLPQHVDSLCGQICKTLRDIEAIVVFAGPGSFTALRIGHTYANALSYGLSVPIVSTHGEDWLEEGLNMVQKSINHKLVIPQYGSEAHITLPSVQKKFSPRIL